MAAHSYYNLHWWNQLWRETQIYTRTNYIRMSKTSQFDEPVIVLHPWCHTLKNQSQFGNHDVTARRTNYTHRSHDVRAQGTYQTPLSLQEENLVRAVQRSTMVLLGPDGVRVIFMLDHMLGPATTLRPDQPRSTDITGWK